LAGTGEERTTVAIESGRNHESICRCEKGERHQDGNGLGGKAEKEAGHKQWIFIAPTDLREGKGMTRWKAIQKKGRNVKKTLKKAVGRGGRRI